MSRVQLIGKCSRHAQSSLIYKLERQRGKDPNQYTMNNSLEHTLVQVQMQTDDSAATEGGVRTHGIELNIQRKRFTGVHQHSTH